MTVRSQTRKKVAEKSRIVTQEGGLAINRGCMVYERQIEKERNIIRQDGEVAADHRQEIAIAGAGIPAAAL